MSALQSQDEGRYLNYFGAMICIAYLIPLHVRPYPSFYNEWVAALGLFILIAGFIHRRKVLLRLPAITLVPIGMMFVITLQIISGRLTSSWDGGLAILYLMLGAISIVIGATIAAEERGSERICAAISYSHLVAGLISALIAALQLVGYEHVFYPFVMLMDHSISRIRPYANIAQTNQLALLLCMALASVWWLFQNNCIKAKFSMIWAATLVVGLVITQSRIAWIILPTFAIVGCTWRSKPSLKLVSIKLIIGLLLLYLLLAFALPAISSIFGSQVNSPVIRASSGYMARLVLLQEAWAMSIAHPWMGVGWYEFGPQQVALAPGFDVATYSRHSHNLVLNFAAELGWPFTVALILSVVIWLKAMMSQSITSQTGLFFLFAIAVGLHSMVEFPLWYGYVLFPFCLMIGMVHHRQFLAVSIGLCRRYVAAIMIVCISSILMIAVDYRRVVQGFNAMEFAAMGVHVERSALQKPEFTLFPHMYKYFNFLDIPITSEMSNMQIADMERTASRFAGVLMLMRMSQVYALNGRPEDAVIMMQVIQRLHPKNYPEAHQSWSNAPSEFQKVFSRMPHP